jgi:hypothetical protein
MWLKQSTAVVISFGPFLDKTDGVTEEIALMGGGAGTGLDHATTGVKLSKNGAALAVRAATITLTTYDANGYYRVTLNATDTNTPGTLRMVYNDAATALPVWQDFMVLPAQVYEALVNGGANYLPCDVQKYRGDIGGAFVDTAGYPRVTIKDGTAQGEILTTAGVIDTVATTTTATNVTTVNGLAANVINANSIDHAAAATSAVTKLRSVFSGTADSGSTSSLTDSALNQADDNYWRGCWLLFTSGNLAGQVRLIESFDAATDTLSFLHITTQSVSTHTYEILPAGAVNLRLWKELAPADLTATRVNCNVSAMAADVITAAAIAADAIGASELAAGAVTEIQAGLATSAALATVQADTGNIQTRLPAALIGGRMDSDVEAINASTEAADDLQFSAATIVRGTASGVPTTTTMPASDLGSTVNDHYNGRIIIFTSGVLADQATNITDYDGATKTLTFTAITSAPAAGTTFVIV